MKRNPIKMNGHWKVALLGFLWLSSCKPCSDPQPTGAGNLLSFMLNDNKWEPGKGNHSDTERILEGGLVLNAHADSQYIYVSARRFLPGSSDKSSKIEIFLKTIKTGTYHLNSAARTMPIDLFRNSCITYTDGETGNVYSTSSAYHAAIGIVRVDTDNRIISGTFEGTLGNSMGETIRISQGRFDINQKTLNQ